MGFGGEKMGVFFWIHLSFFRLITATWTCYGKKGQAKPVEKSTSQYIQSKAHIFSSKATQISLLRIPEAQGERQTEL